MRRVSSFLSATLLSIASNAAVLFVLKFGLFLWPERLPANSQNIFWLASGVNVAGLLVLGLRYWPVLLLNAFPAWLFAGEPLALTSLGATTNALEALLAAWLIRRLGGSDGLFDRLREVGALLGASLVAPLANTLIIPIYFCVSGLMPWSNYEEALANWNLSNGAAMVVLVPLFTGLWRRDWSFAGRRREFLILSAAATVLCAVAFNEVFEGAATNFVFIVFPVVIYAAVRFGTGQMAALLWMVLVAIYGSLAMHSRALSPERMSEVIWFVQAFCWVLAATGLLVAALEAERRRAEAATAVERERALEVSLREERARLDALRYQLNPHFLFNSLNSIYSTLPSAGAEVPGRMLVQLSSYLRSTLDNDDDHDVALCEEIRSMEQYLAIEKSRFGDDLKVTVSVAAEVEECRVPAFLLQPLVENAIVHGFEATPGVFQLAIGAKVEAKQLLIEVANTGRWKASDEGGVGLENTRRRLALMFGPAASHEIQTTDGWVRVKIAIPAGAGKEEPCAV